MVRSPEMRVNLEEGLRVLAELSDPDTTTAWPSLADGLNWIDDNAPSPAAASVGSSLRDADEARAVQTVHDAWTAVLLETEHLGGALATDAAHLAAQSWPRVQRAASRALRILEDGDAQV